MCFLGETIDLTHIEWKMQKTNLVYCYVFEVSRNYLKTDNK